MTTGTTPRRIQSVDRAFQILHEIGDRGRCSVSEIAEAIGLSPGTVHTHLTTLKLNGFVQQEDGEYKLGMEFIPFSERVRNQSPLYRAARPQVDSLAHEYDAVAHLSAEYEGKVLILHETFGEDAVGKRIHTRKRNQPQRHIHCTAAGKVILAHLPEDRARGIVAEQGLPGYTPNTITEEEALFDELGRIRDRRYAVNNEETIPGNRGIGAPVLSEDGGVHGAISISGPANSWRSEGFEDELAEAVIRAADNTEINLYTEEQPS